MIDWQHTVIEKHSASRGYRFQRAPKRYKGRIAGRIVAILCSRAIFTVMWRVSYQYRERSLR